MTEREHSRIAARRVAIIRHAEEVTGNVARTCRYYGISRTLSYTLASSLRRARDRGSATKLNDAEVQSRFNYQVYDAEIGYVYIKPATLRLNGKVERSHRIDAEEGLPDARPGRDRRHEAVHRQVQEREDFDNYRPHGGCRRSDPV